MPVGIEPEPQVKQLKSGEVPSSVGIEGVEGAKAKKIGELYDYALSKESNVKRSITYRTVDATEATRIKEATGLTVEGYTKTIDNYSIRHILKEHGNPEVEQKRGQIAVTKEDILRIPEITLTADKVNLGEKSKTGLETVKYEKKINGIIYTIEEVRTGKKELIPITMYKIAGVAREMPVTAQPHTPETTSTPLPKTIPPPPEPVKSSVTEAAPITPPEHPTLKQLQDKYPNYDIGYAVREGQHELLVSAPGRRQ